MSNLAEWISSWSLGGKLSLLWFAVISGLIVFFSMKLVQNLGVISTKTKLNDSFLGGAFVSVITSAPELVTEIAQAVNLTPEVGVADDVGSNAFAIFLVAISALIFVKQMFLNKLESFTKFALWVSAIIMIIFTLLLVINRDVMIGKQGTFIIGLIPLSFFIFWVISLFVTYKRGDSDELAVNKIKNISLWKASLYFVIWALLLIFAAVVLNWVVLSIEQGFGFGKTVAGGIFLAISTSLPEIVVFFFMLSKGYRAGAVLALVGSQIFNLAITFFGDMIYNQNATFNLLKVGHIWPLSLLTTLMAILIAFQATISHFFKHIFVKKRYYLIIPILISMGYVIGWTLITIYWGG